MIRTKWPVVLLLSLGACSSKSDDTLPLLPPLLGGAPVDVQLRGALAAAGVTPLADSAAQDPELVALGQALFFDPILSGDRNVSCATCHHVSAATADGLSVSIGAGGTGTASSRTLGSGSMIARNAPPLFNLASAGPMFWDGRVSRTSAGLRRRSRR